MDWNWFYSSVAQSAAAIVGIFAAFIITKIVNNQGEYNRKKRKISQIINESHKLMERANKLSFKWYNDNIRDRELDNLERLIEGNNDKNEPEYYYNKLNFSMFDCKKDILDFIELVIWKRNRSRELNITDPSHPLNFKITRITNWRDVEREREIINACLIDVNHNNREVSSFISEISENPESSGLITSSIVSILLLFYVGVIYPLTFLPINISNNGNQSSFDIVIYFFNWSPKGAILISISIIFTIILGIFFVINLRLKFSSNIIGELKKYACLATYSKHFAIMESNMQAKLPLSTEKPSS